MDLPRIIDMKPTTAEELMRSRFEAFKNSDERWLLETWHPSTRPEHVDLTDNPVWRGLQIIDTVSGTAGAETGVVEFKATFLKPDGGVGVLHERSRFVQEDGHWFYLDGTTDMTEEP